VAIKNKHRSILQSFFTPINSTFHPKFAKGGQTVKEKKKQAMEKYMI